LCSRGSIVSIGQHGAGGQEVLVQLKTSAKIMGDVADPQVILPETVDKCSDFHFDVIRWAEVTRAVWLIPMDSNDKVFRAQLGSANRCVSRDHKI
jgi:hypothetical protein